MPKKTATKQAGKHPKVVDLTLRAKSAVERIHDETGVTQKAFLEKLVEWYTAQDVRIQSMILSPYVEVRKGLARMVVEDMIANPTKDFDAPQHRIDRGLVTPDEDGGGARATP